MLKNKKTTAFTQKSYVFALLLLWFIPLGVYAQSSDLGNWLIYIGNKKINQKWNWHHEVQYRNYDAISDLEQLLLRTGIGYNLTENNHNILLGYGFIHSENYISGLDEKVDLDEHRIFQQYIYRHTFRTFSVQHRFRLEQRFIESDFRGRFRYFLAATLPLTQKETDDNTFYLSAYNELFLNTENIVFDRNRLYGGLGYKVNGTLRFEVGYMNQFLNKGGRDQVNIFAYVTL
ncbi:DUF2490 domain-containing protein [Arenibacter sp. GZD96]|uniref:DUF2490 domain-containing protein n=1 Tax=Aurantibrevibacter litoralis TaxID=3106030 RepID=UPI002AFEB4F0|nr:DUF2490 domain-containing protein [Arenibacter sp. GZD-96]MEA1784533.1 DUF2490 domain-containing protein [Arenibacter sp. GZD-96]